MSFCAIVCFLQYKNNNLYHVSKEDVKWLSYLGVKYYLFIFGFIISFIITLLVSYVWKVCIENMFPFVDSIFLCSLFTRHFNCQYLKIIVSIFFSVFDLMNCCKFQKPMTKQYWKRALLNKKCEIKCLNTRCFTSTKIMYAKWCYLTHCWYWRHKNIQKFVFHYPLNYYLLYIYLMLQFKDENEPSYLYVQGAP